LLAWFGGVRRAAPGIDLGTVGLVGVKTLGAPSILRCYTLMLRTGVRTL